MARTAKKTAPPPKQARKATRPEKPKPTTKAPAAARESAPAAAPALDSVQKSPIIVRDQSGRIVDALFIEAANCSAGLLTVAGWHLGLGTVELHNRNGLVSTIVRSTARTDVAFALGSADYSLGFTLTVPTEPDALTIVWQFGVDGENRVVSAPLSVVSSDSDEPAVPPESPREEVVAPPEAPPAPVQVIKMDRFVGHTAHGWSAKDGKRSGFSVLFGERPLGYIKPNIPRPDVQQSINSEDVKLGFEVMLGGILHFSALSAGCERLDFSQLGTLDVITSVPLAPSYEEALTFSPMKAFSRVADEVALGGIRNIRFSSRLDISVLYEAAVGPNTYGIDFYQESEPGKLRRIARFSFESKGQICNFDMKLISRTSPVLVVVSHATQVILLTECIPLPQLFSDETLPLIEYHSLLANGQPAFDVRAKIARSHLDHIILGKMTQKKPTETTPTRANTAVILYSKDNYDPVASADEAGFLHLSDSIVILDKVGMVKDASGTEVTLKTYVSRSKAAHFLFAEIGTTVRPDFWAAINHNAFRFQHNTKLAHGYLIYFDGTSRPVLVKPGILLHDRFREHSQLSPGVAITTKAALQEAMVDRTDDFKSGRLRIENAFCDFSSSEVVTIPLVLETQRVIIPPAEVARFWATQIPLDSFPKSAPTYEAAGDVSVIINYRDCPSQTIRCLEALSIQKFDGKLQVILVNNQSLASSVQLVTQRATELFGSDAVVAIDYNQRFNHSDQCNIAAKAATGRFILMLSNDSYLVTKDAIATLREITDIPWVGTCGFRILGQKAGRTALASLGLTVGTGRYVFAGGSPLRTLQPPPYLVDKVLEVSGNTFAAVMIRKDVYDDLGGLDAEAFPTNYNDVDFCIRASARGLRHVAVGSAVVEHSGRGSREMDLDLPIDSRIQERIGNFAELAKLCIQPV
jgi:GT2 family glycosyltransferase